MIARTVVVAGMAVLLLSGCMTTRTYEVTQARQDPYALSKMCSGLIGKKVMITTTNGYSNVGDLFSITPDRVDFLQEGAVRHLFIPLDSILSIVRTGSTSGSIIGLLGGGLAGGAAGAAIASASVEEPRNTGEAIVLAVAQVPAITTGMGFLLGFAVGGALGAVIGTQITAEEIYTFNRMTPIRDTLRLSPKEILQETATSITVRSGQMELTLPKLSVQIIRDPDRITIIGPRKLLRPEGVY